MGDITWSTRYNIHKNDRYSGSSTNWTLVSLNFKVETYGIKLIYDQIDTNLADICFSNIKITDSLYQLNIVNYFKDLFQSIPNYRKNVILRFSFENDMDLLTESRLLKNDKNHLCLEFSIVSIEQNEDYLDYIKIEEESNF